MSFYPQCLTDRMLLRSSPAEEDVTRGLHTKRRVKIRQLRLFEASRVLLIVQEYVPEELWK